MKSPVLIVPEALQAMYALSKSIEKTGFPTRTRHLVLLRVSQINGCGFCVDMHARDAKQAGDTDQRINAVAAWFDAPWFTDAERAALALAEHATRLSDRHDAVPDAIWDEAKRHYDERQLSGLLIAIAVINAWNRFNVPTRTVAGTPWK